MKAFVTFLALFLLTASVFADGGSEDRVVKDSRIDNEPSFNGDGAIGLNISNRWVKLAWSTLEEVDSNGHVVQSEELQGKNYAWGQVGDKDLEDERGHQSGQHFPHANFSLLLPNGAWFNVSAWVITSDVTVGNVTAPRNSVKFNVYISKWTFANSSNTLRLIAEIDGENDGGDDQGHQVDELSDDKDSNKTKEHRMTYGIGFLNSPTQATYDGNSTGTVNVTYSLTGKPIVTWTFVSFTYNVSYDPVFGSSSGVQIIPSLLVLVILAISAFFGSN